MSLVRINRHPENRQLVVFGLLWLVIFAAFAATGWWKGRPPTVNAALAIVAVVIPVLGLVRRGWLRWVYLATAYLTMPIGMVISFFLLAVVYYLVLTPIGLALRLFGHEAITRRFDRNAVSYWSPRHSDENESTERYFRQF